MLPSLGRFFQRVKAATTGRDVDVDVTPKVSQADLDKARKQVEKATEKVAAARSKEADAAGAVRTAEAKLQQLRESGNARADQLVAAEERVAAARRRSEAAQRSLSQAEGAQRSAERRVERIRTELEVDDGQATSAISRFKSRAQAALGALKTKVEVDTETGEQRAIGMGQRIRNSLGAAGLSAGGAAGAGIMSGIAGAAVAVGAAALGIGVALSAGVAQAIDVETARAKLAAQLGLSAEDSRRYGAIAGRLYSGAYGESLDQVNEALAAVTQNIGRMDDPSLERVSGKVLNLASVFGVDLQGATGAVATMIRNGLAPNADVALDVLTRGFQLGADKAGDLLDTMTEYSGQFQKFGLDASTATGLLTQGLRAGARDADFVADAIKEFSIRAIDGSESTAKGFSQIGLNARDMAAKIAKGGPEAAGALDLTLDRLRAMPDPVQRSQAAVALFGTKAEDLGQALFALDPSSAAAALGQVGGAADAMGRTLQETSGARIERFKRTLQTGFVDFIGGAVLPVFDTLGRAGESIFGSAWGPVSQFLGFLAGTGGTILAVLAGIVAVSWLWTAANTALAGSMLAAYWPVILIIAGIAALVAAVIYAYNNFGWFRDAVNACWNGIVAGATWLWSVLSPIFSAIGAVFMWLWSAIISPVVSWIASQWSWLSIVLGILIGPIGWLILAFTTFRDQTIAVLTAVGAFFSWVWTGILWPIISAIGTALAYLGLIIATVLVAPFVIAWNIISAIVVWAWNSIILPVFQAIWGFLVATLGPVFTWFWGLVQMAWAGIVMAVQFAWAVLSAIFGAIIAFILGVFAAGWRFLWNGVIAPVWNGIVMAIQIAWGIISAIFGAIVAFLQATLGPIFTWLLNTIIAPVWNAIVSAITVAWGVIRGVFDVGMRAVDAVGRAFQFVADWIARAWDSIKNAARAPIQFVVDVVYNNGIRKVWNGIAGLFGMAQLPEVRFAEGGVLPGYTPGRDVHQFTSPTGGRLALSGGEGILVPEAVRGLGGPAFVGWANRTFSGGRSSGGSGTPQQGFARGGMTRRFADGGIFGGIADFVGDSAAFFGSVFTDPAGAVRKLFSGVLGDGERTPGRGGWTDAVKKVPGKVVEGVITKVKKWVADLAAMGGGAGGNWAPVAAQALAITGHQQSSLWRVLKQIQIESGGNPRAINLWDSNAKKGTPSKGLIQTIDPTFQRWRLPGLPNDPYHPLSNIVAGIRYADARYGHIDRIWPKTLGYDAGGVLPQGISMAVNRTSGSERMAVFTDRQWAALGGVVTKLGVLPDTLGTFTTRLRDGLDALHGRLSSTTTTVTTRLGETSTQFRSAAGSIDGSAGAIRTAAGAITSAAGTMKAAAAAAARPAPPPPPRPAPKPAGRMVQAEDGSWVPVSFYGRFDRGGMARGTGVLAKDVITPERVLSPGQTRDFSALSRALSAGRLVELPTGTLGTGGAVELQTPKPVMSRQSLAGLAEQRTGAGVTVNVQGAPHHDVDELAQRVVAKLEWSLR